MCRPLSQSDCQLFGLSLSEYITIPHPLGLSNTFNTFNIVFHFLHLSVLWLLDFCLSPVRLVSTVHPIGFRYIIVQNPISSSNESS